MEFLVTLVVCIFALMWLITLMFNPPCPHPFWNYSRYNDERICIKCGKYQRLEGNFWRDYNG